MLHAADHLVEKAALRVTRRGLLGSAGSAALGATPGVAHTSRATATERALPPTAVAYDPNFLLGQVVDVASDGGLRVIDADGRSRQARLIGSSRYWKAAQWNVGELARGDCLTGRGERNAAGELEFDVVWANIARFLGHVRIVSSRSFTFEHASGRITEMHASDGTIFRNAAGQESFGDTSVLVPDQRLYVISYTNPSTGIEMAHRVEATGPSIADTIDEVVELVNDNIPELPLLDGNEPNFDVARRGNATYFCCGSQACGSRCDKLGTNGACGFCSSSGHYMAWPKISNCTAGCWDCCLPSDFPRYACGTGFEIENACSGKATFVQIADCGPNPHCRSTGCKSYDSVRFDLTPCAFTAVGGSLDIGHCNLWVSSPS